MDPTSIARLGYKYRWRTIVSSHKLLNKYNANCSIIICNYNTVVFLFVIALTKDTIGYLFSPKYCVIWQLQLHIVRSVVVVVNVIVTA